MKLLFIANRIPYPPFRGDKLKIYHLGKCLSAFNEVHLIAFLENKNDLQYKKELEKIFASVTLISLPKWKSYINVVHTTRVIKILHPEDIFTNKEDREQYEKSKEVLIKLNFIK